MAVVSQCIGGAAQLRSTNMLVSHTACLLHLSDLDVTALDVGWRAGSDGAMNQVHPRYPVPATAV